jgi:prevent-host-death family protein
MTRAVTLTRARSELTRLVHLIERKGDHVIVTKYGRPVALLMSLAEYASFEESVEVLSDPGAMEDLRLSDRDVRAGRLYSWNDFKRRQRRRNVSHTPGGRGR